MFMVKCSKSIGHGHGHGHATSPDLISSGIYTSMDFWWHGRSLQADKYTITSTKPPFSV